MTDMSDMSNMALQENGAAGKRAAKTGGSLGKALVFASRNRREILRDPLSFIFGAGFPVVLLLLITLMKSGIPNAPAELFPLEQFAPGMAVFGFSFLALFLGNLMAGDSSSSFLSRLFASPLSARAYILGYALPLFPLALAQGVLCFGLAFPLGLPFRPDMLGLLPLMLIPALLYIAFGLLLGSFLQNSRQVGGAATVLVNLAAWLSGTWFDLNLMGGAFKTVCELLPFSHVVSLVSAAVSGDWAAVPLHCLWVLGYALLIGGCAVLLFRRKMRR